MGKGGGMSRGVFQYTNLFALIQCMVYVFFYPDVRYSLHNRTSITNLLTINIYNM